MTTSETPTPEQQTTTAAFERALIYFWSMMNETSTARGFFSLLTIAIGWTVDPDKLVQYTSAAVALSAAMKMILPDLWSSLRKKYPDALPPSA